MYTITFENGKPVEGTGEYEHASTARGEAQKAAERTGHVVQVRTGDKVRFRIRPTGEAAVPAGTLVAKTNVCIAGQGRGACFCPGCRVRRARLNHR